MELSIEFKKDEINLIDDYNKNILLVNILDRLIFFLKCNNCDESLVSFYDEMNSLYLIGKKFELDHDNDHKSKSEDEDENSKDIQDVKNPKEKCFPCLLFLDKEDFCKIKMPQRDRNNLSIENLKLLSLFEEEIRKFLKKKKEIIKKLNNKHVNSSHYLEKSDELSYNNRELLDKLFSKMIENFENFNDIFENFKNSLIQQENKEIATFEQTFRTMKNLLERLMNIVIEELTGEKSIHVMNEVKSRLTEENNILSDEIKRLQFEIYKYTEQGDELTNLVREYKKLCNLIECKKKA
jgi:hypothetical protein